MTHAGGLLTIGSGERADNRVGGLRNRWRPAYVPPLATAARKCGAAGVDRPSSHVRDSHLEPGDEEMSQEGAAVSSQAAR